MSVAASRTDMAGDASIVVAAITNSRGTVNCVSLNSLSSAMGTIGVSNMRTAMSGISGSSCGVTHPFGVLASSGRDSTTGSFMGCVVDSSKRGVMRSGKCVGRTTSTGTCRTTSKISNGMMITNSSSMAPIVRGLTRNCRTMGGSMAMRIRRDSSAANMGVTTRKATSVNVTSHSLGSRRGSLNLATAIVTESNVTIVMGGSGSISRLADSRMGTMCANRAAA